MAAIDELNKTTIVRFSKGLSILIHLFSIIFILFILLILVVSLQSKDLDPSRTCSSLPLILEDPIQDVNLTEEQIVDQWMGYPVVYKNSPQITERKAESAFGSAANNSPLNPPSMIIPFEMHNPYPVIRDNYIPNLEFSVFYYEIQPQDTLYKIARKFHLSIDTIISFNEIKEGHHIITGRLLLIPNQDGILYKIQSGDNLSSICENYALDPNEVIESNYLWENRQIAEGERLFLPGARLSDEEREKALELQFVLPVSGRITSLMGFRSDPFENIRKFHPGIDIAAPMGSNVQAMRRGKVILARYYGGYGKCVIIEDDTGFQTRYGHLSEILVEVGDVVSTGHLIGKVGSTGHSTGPHLHFEIRQNGELINPSNYFLGTIGGYIRSNYQ